MEHIGEILKRRKEQSRSPSHHPSETDNPAEAKELCPVCRGGRFIHPLMDGKPDYAKTIPCRHCMTPEDIRRSLGVSSLESTFKNFDVVEGAEDAYRAAMLISGMKTDWKLLLIYGTWGNGKTHLLEAIALTIWDAGEPVKIQTFPDFVAGLKATFDRSREPEHIGPTFNDQMAALCNMPYLLLDDVGAAGSFTPFSLEQLERIMLARYRDNLFTVITTNLDYNLLPHFVTSRFSDSERARTVLNGAPDYRPKKKK